MKNCGLKILIQIICVSLILGHFQTSPMICNAFDIKEDYGQVCYDIMKETGITDVDSGEYIPDKIITRAEFIKLVWIVANQPVIQSDESFFDDVSQSSVYFKYITSAYKIGIVSGNGNSQFNPDSEITLNQCLKIIVSFIGYEEIALSRGGYPYGYISAANECDILYRINTDSDAPVNMSIAFGLLFNMLNAPLYEYVSLGKYNVKDAYENKTLMTTQYNIYKHSGIFTTDAYTDIISPETDLDINRIRIGGMVFEDSKNSSDKYLGYNVDVFYRDDGKSNVKTALYISINEENTVYSTDSNNIYGVGEEFEFYDEITGRMKKLSVGSMVPYIVNGRMKSITYDDAHGIKKGLFEFISNDGDGSIDIIKISDFETYVIGGISADASLIQTEDGQRIELDPENSDYSFSVFKNGAQISADEIKVGDVLLIAQTMGNVPNKKNLVVCDDKIRGTVSEMSEDEISVDKVSYRADKSVMAKIKLGRPYEFIVDGFGNIVDITTTDPVVYGYLDKLITENFGTVKCRIFTENGRWVELRFAEKMVINGIRRTAKDAYDEIINKKEDPRQLIRYRVNEDASVMFLETAEKISIGSEKEESANQSNMFRLSYEGELYYRSGHKTFDGKFFLTDSTKIFYIPENYDSSLYRMKSPASFVADTKYIVQAYDVDENLNAGVLMMHKMANVPTDSIMVVKSKGRVFDPKGNDVPSLKVYAYGSELTLPVNIGSGGLTQDRYDSIQNGDYIQVSMDDAGLVKGIMNYNLVSNKYYFSGSTYLYSGIIAGVVRERDNSYGRIRVSYNENGDSCGISFNNNTTVCIYNKKEEFYTLASVDDILKSDTVIVRNRYLSGLEILIIRD